MSVRNTLFLFSALLLSGCQQDAQYVAMGTLERDTITLSSPVSEYIDAVQVKEGDKVHRGDTLIQLNTKEARFILAKAEAELNQAKAELLEKQHGAREEDRQAAKAGYEAAKATEEKARLAYQRTLKLFRTHTVGEADLDNTQADYQQKKKLTTERLAQWKALQNGTRVEIIEQLKAKVSAAEETVKLAQKSLDDLTIVAPDNATVVQLPWVAGNRVTTNQPLIRLETKSDAYAQIYIPQTALNQIHEGQTIAVSVDGHEQPYQGVVRYIRRQPAFTPYYALNERDRARLMYLTKVDIIQSDRLPTGITLEVPLP